MANAVEISSKMLFSVSVISVPMLMDRDVDVYRFSLADEQYVRIEAIPPADASVRFTLVGGSPNRGFAPGEPVVYETILLPGDHFLEVKGEPAFEGFYQLLMTRLDPLATPADLEPNDSQAQAHEFTAEDTYRLGINQASQTDWFLYDADPWAGDTLDMRRMTKEVVRSILRPTSME